MRISGYPTEWVEAEGLQPIELQDIVLSARADELHKLATFVAEVATKAEQSGTLTLSENFGDSKKNPKTGIRIIIKSLSAG